MEQAELGGTLDLKKKKKRFSKHFHKGKKMIHKKFYIRFVIIIIFVFFGVLHHMVCPIRSNGECAGVCV